MTDSDKLRAQMWDLVYGLLSSDESQALIARIKSDPGAARLYAEVRLQADLVGYASRIDDSSFALEVPGAAGKPAPAKATKQGAGLKVAAGDKNTRGGSWLVGAGATALALLLAVGHFWPQPNERQIALRFIVTEVESPAAITAGLTNKIALRTFHLDAAGERSAGVPTNVDVLLRSRDGLELLRQKVVTSSSGEGAVDLPGTALAPGARLEMEAAEPLTSVAYAEMSYADRLEMDEKLGETALAVDLPVQPEPPVSYFLQAEPVATPGQPMQVATWNFSSFSAKPVSQEEAREAAKNIAGVVLADPAANAAGAFIVVNGVVPAPAGRVPEAGALAFQVQDQERSRTAGGAMLGQRSASPAAPSATPADVRLQQAQGAARQEAAKPAAEAVAAKGLQLEDLQDQTRLARGALAAGGKAAEEAQPAAPAVPAGGQIAFDVPAELAGKPVVAAAANRGITVASAPVPEGNQAAGVGGFGGEAKKAGQSVTLDVPPEADGRIDVALVDQSVAPPQVVHQQSFYRQPARKLQIDLPNLPQRFTPGERVQLQLQVTDEAGQPAAETLVGVRCWNEAVVKQAAQQPVTLEAAVRDGVSSWGDASHAVDGKDLAKLTELLRKEHFAAAPGANAAMPVRVSNLAAVRARFESAVAVAQAERQGIVQSIGRVLILGGLLLAAALGLLAMLKVSSKLQVAAPAIAIAGASLLVGMAWVGWWSPAGEQQIALAPQATRSEPPAKSADATAYGYAVEPQFASPAPATTTAPGPDSLAALGAIQDKKTDEAPGERFGAAFGGRGGVAGAAGAAEGKALPELERRLADDGARALERQAPASLYFNPQLLTDAGGRVTIEFVMPPVDSEYRLLIDALGHGRIGSKQQLIIGRAADGK